LARDGVPVALTNRLFETLLAFVRAPGRVLTKDELMEAVWPGRYMEEASLKQAIFTLRRALSDSGDDARYIVTAPGRGYSFAAPVQKVNRTSAAAQLLSYSWLSLSLRAGSRSRFGTETFHRRRSNRMSLSLQIFRI
jgi:DNA-binding winged helix-turn-helix (wHTH) protein